MAESRDRTSSLDTLRHKADLLRAVDLGSVDKDLNELPKSNAGKSSDDVSPEDDIAISEAISQAETELANADGNLIPFLSICVIIVGVAIYFILEDVKEGLFQLQNK